MTVDGITWILSTDNILYVSGENVYGSAGVGNANTAISSFTKVKGLPENINIKKICTESKWNAAERLTMVLLEDGSVWCSGTILLGKDGNYFVEFINSSMFESKIVDIETYTPLYFYVLLENGEVFFVSNKNTFTKIDGLENITEIQCAKENNTLIAKNNNNEFFMHGRLSNVYLGLVTEKILEEDGETYKSLIAVNDAVPQEMLENGDRIKEIISAYPTSTSVNYYYIMESGDVWGTGDINYLGVGDERLTTSESNRMDLVCLIDAEGNNGISTLNNVKIVSSTNSIIEYCTPGRYPLILIDENNNAYTTGDQSIMYRNSIIQSSWKHIASDVEKVFVGGDNRVAYVDDTNNAYVILSDYREIGIESISEEIIKGNNFRKITDNNLVNKVNEIYFSEGAIFILTTENNLYTAGKGKYDTTWVGNAYSGLGEDVIEKQTLLKDNVQKVATIASGTILSGNILLSNSQLFFWGQHYYHGLGLEYDAFNTLTNVDVESSGLDFSKISKMKIGWVRTHILTEDGNLYASGLPAGCGLGNEILPNFISTMKKFDIDEKIIDIQYSGYDHYPAIILTENGNVYGWGNEQILGKNSNVSQINGYATKLNISNVKSIHGMAEGFVAVKNDGSVWGTGFNIYGILGRWIGVGRGESNSRYKTALNWVECPELEI